jgi:hypothetical protein
VAGEDDNKGTLTYIIIAFIVILIVISSYIYISSQFKQSYIPNDYLDDSWTEDLMKRETGSQLFGLEKWVSLTYKIENDYNVFLTVTTLNTILMIDEEELIEKMKKSIQDSVNDEINFSNNENVITGERILKNNHKSKYIIYRGNDTSKNPTEEIYIIGEVWNCGSSGTSVICFGYAQMTNSSIKYTQFWEKMIGDEKGTFGTEGYVRNDGLIYNVLCH